MYSAAECPKCKNIAHQVDESSFDYYHNISKTNQHIKNNHFVFGAITTLFYAAKIKFSKRFECKNCKNVFRKWFNNE